MFINFFGVNTKHKVWVYSTESTAIFFIAIAYVTICDRKVKEATAYLGTINQFIRQ